MSSYGGLYTGPAYGGATDVGLPPVPGVVGPYVEPPVVVHLRGADAVRVGQIDDVVKLQLVVRHQDVGAWVLDLHPNSPTVQALLAAFAAGPIGHTGIEVVRGGQLLFSGPITRLDRTRKGGVDRMTASGPDDTVWLTRRLVMPQPATSAPPYSTSAYDVRSGVASTVMIAYANADAGPGAIVARRVADLTMGADPVVGTSVPGQQGRYQTLLELEQSIALAGGDLGFRVISDGAGGLQFQVYQPADRTVTVKFSRELGNLGDFDYELAAPGGTDAVGGGGGELTARTIVEAGDSAAITTWGRIEFFRDRRDTTDTTEITSTLNEELAKRAQTVAATITPIDTPQVAFGVHYDLGDRVTAVLDGIEVAEVVREVKLTYDASGVKIEPTLASPGSSPPALPDFFRDRHGLVGRVSGLERR
jgi:hypothetical protein